MQIAETLIKRIRINTSLMLSEEENLERDGYGFYFLFILGILFSFLTLYSVFYYTTASLNR